MKELKDYLTEKNILTLFFPGLLATYPIWLICLDAMVRNKGQLKDMKDIITPLSVVIYVLLFVAIYGIGYFIKRMAIRLLEWPIDDFTEKRIIRNDEIAAKQKTNAAYTEKWIHGTFIVLIFIKGSGSDKTKFMKGWYGYLNKRVKIDKAPPLVAFYHDFIYSYHFQLTSIVALVSQALLIWLPDVHMLSHNTRLLITIVSILLVLELFRQSLASAWEMHRLRVQIVDLVEDEE